MRNLNDMYAPGALVRHPTQQDWGVGQVQSNIAGRITVNFENTGKVVLISEHVTLLPVQG